MAAAGVLPPGGGTAVEFPSPHGGTWLDGLAGHGFAAVPLGRRADVVVDACFGVMHEADQQAALRTRVDAVAPDGTLVLMFHSLAAIMDGGQWNALRLGHYAYYSTPGMVGMLAELGMTSAMLAIPAAIAALAEVGASPVKVHCERVIWYGGEIQFRSRPSGAEAVILGCTEIMLLVGPEDGLTPIVNTWAIHAAAAIERAIPV